MRIDCEINNVWQVACGAGVKAAVRWRGYVTNSWLAGQWGARTAILVAHNTHDR